MKSCFFLPFLLLFSLSFKAHPCRGSDTIFPGQSLSGNQTIRSDDGGTFELGFFTPGNSRNYYIGIWYGRLPTKTVVWVANRDQPLSDPSSSTLQLSHDGRLVLLNQSKTEIWSTDVNSTTPDSTIAVLLDDGNLVVRGGTNSSSVWTGKNFVNVPEIDRDYYIKNFRFVKTENESYFTFDAGFPSVDTRFVLDYTGQLKQIVWGKDFTEWAIYWTRPTLQWWKIAASELVETGKNTITWILIGTIGGFFLVLAIVLIVFRILCRGQKQTVGPVQASEDYLVLFKYKDLQTATKNFSEKLGEGGCGSVFKGTLPNSSAIAIASYIVNSSHGAVTLLDNRLEGNADMEELSRACKIACWCIQDDEKERPTMGQVVRFLEGVSELGTPPIPRFLRRLLKMAPPFKRRLTVCNSNLYMSKSPSLNQISS
ncbi:unnamed protein product, partial [Vitis vinifera]